jgi:serine/threonine protein kinase
LPASEPGTPPHIFATIKPHITQDGETSSLASEGEIPQLLYTQLPLSQNSRPDIGRRASHDLFECIEQSENKRLTDLQARYVFAQVVDVVDYLDRQGIAHRDIKDENIVIDKNLKVSRHGLSERKGWNFMIRSN